MQPATRRPQVRSNPGASACERTAAQRPVRSHAAPRLARLRAALGLSRTGAPRNNPNPLAAALLAVGALLALAAPAAAAEPACPNESLRTGPSAALPDCRAYELVSPPGLEPHADRTNDGAVNGYQASVAGGRMAFYSKGGPPAGSASYGFYFLATRGTSGWSTEDVVPPQSTAGGTFCFPFPYYSPDLSRLVLQDGLGWGEGYPSYKDVHGALDCSHDEPALVGGEPRGAQNLFLRDNEHASYQLVNVTPPALPPRDAWFQAGSSDFSHVVFTDPNALTAEAPAPPLVSPNEVQSAVTEDLYDWAGGVVRLVTILPGGEAVWGLLANGSESDAVVSSATWTHAVSADGERVFFRAGGTVGTGGSVQEPEEGYLGGNLYLRENATQPRVQECAGPARACTVQVDAAQGGPESGGGHFQWASSDGSRAFFTDERNLVPGAKAEPEKPDLYEYDLTRPEGSRLLDLTLGGGEPANVQGLSGISEDGSYVYFVADGKLTGEQANSQEAKAIAGRPNLYLHHAGATTFIATLDAKGEEAQTIATRGDTCDWDSFTGTGETQKSHGVNCMTARVTPDGAFLAFDSKRSLTGYDNVVQSTGLRNREIFLYEAATNRLSCASCDPRGLAPTADPTKEFDPHMLRPMYLQANEALGTTYLTHDLTDDGKVLFETVNELLPSDKNGQLDVYQFAAGQLSLISSGKSPDASWFEDASANGSDVFFITTQALVGGDSDNAMSLYDARAGGGFAQSPAPSEPCGSGEACRGVSSGTPAGSSPLTAAFVGPGNPSPPPPPPPPPLTLHQKLVKALAACHRLHRRSARLRGRCERQARVRYRQPRRTSK